MKRIQFGTGFTWLMDGFTSTGERTAGTNRNMKHCPRKPLLGGVVLAALVLAFSSSQATLLTYEGFPYVPTGPLSIDGQGGGTGWDVNWGQFLGGASTYSITNGSLADPSGLLFTSSNRVFTTAGFAGRYFTLPGDWAFPSSTKYFSVLIRPANTPATNHYYGLQIFSNNANTGNGHDLFVGKNGSGLNYGLEYTTNDVLGASNVFVHAYSGVPAAANQTVLLVVRVDFGSSIGVSDNFRLYVNPTPGNPEPAVPDATITDDIGTQNGVALNTGNGGLAFFDEVRLGTTFASVTPTTGAADPDLLTSEPFAYNQGVVTATLDAQPSDGTQASNGWDNVTWGQFLGGATNYTIGSGSLSDPSGKLLTSGNRTQTSSPATNNTFAGRYNKFTGYGANGTTAYFSFLVRPGSFGDTNGYIGFQMFTSLANGDLLAGVFNGASPNYGLQHGSTNASSSVAAVSNQTAFLVIRGDYTSGVDTFRLYVNPTPGDPEPVTADATLSYNIGTQNGIAFNVGNGAAASFDEIRIGTNYTDVTPAVPVITTTNKFNITSIAQSGNNIVLTWNTTGGNTNVVQATNGSNGNYNTNGFANISAQMIIGGASGVAVVTNYVDTLGATNLPARYYRVRQVP